MLTRTPALRALSLVLVVLSVALGALAVASLRDGITELPRHWWSTLAVLAPLVLAIMLWGASGVRR